MEKNMERQRLYEGFLRLADSPFETGWVECRSLDQLGRV